MIWTPVEQKKPPCPRDENALGTPVLIWPRGLEIAGDGFCFYGKRATGRPAFYLHGAEIYGVTHWMLMPVGPKGAK